MPGEGKGRILEFGDLGTGFWGLLARMHDGVWGMGKKGGDAGIVKEYGWGWELEYK
jgi:hypothetical protein